MKNLTSIELLAPAKNAEFGVAAINHGADAVYIGAPRFGARAAVSNTIDEIASLIKHAHLFRAKVYATLNTILFDDELEDARPAPHLHQRGLSRVLVDEGAVRVGEVHPDPGRGHVRELCVDAVAVEHDRPAVELLEQGLRRVAEVATAALVGALRRFGEPETGGA